MALWKALGFVPVPSPGTPVRATVNVAAVTDSNSIATPTKYLCMAILFQVDKGNTAVTYVGDHATFQKNNATNGQLVTLPIPTPNLLQSAGANVPNVPNGINAADYYIDADVAGNGVWVSVLIS